MAPNLWKKALSLPLSPKARWEWYLEHQYGLSYDEHKEMVACQGGLCAICGKKKKLNIDHNHKTGQVRELLCRNCNYKVLGLIEKDVILAEKALKYLKKWNKKR